MGVEVTLKFHTKEVMHSIDEAAARKMLEAVNEVRTATLETLSGSRSGRTYKVPGTSRTYTASAPGEPPATATAGLRQSVRGIVETEGRELTGIVGTPLEQGPMLEFGTTKMAPRPWLRIAFEKTIPKINQIFGGRWF